MYFSDASSSELAHLVLNGYWVSSWLANYLHNKMRRQALDFWQELHSVSVTSPNRREQSSLAAFPTAPSTKFLLFVQFCPSCRQTTVNIFQSFLCKVADSYCSNTIFCCHLFTFMNLRTEQNRAGMQHRGGAYPQHSSPQGWGPNLHFFKSTDRILTMGMTSGGWRGAFLLFSNWQFTEGGVGSRYDRYRELSLWRWKSLSRDRLCDPMDYTVHKILQARILEWVAISFSRWSSSLRDWSRVSCIAGRFFISWATKEPKNYP